MAFAPTLFHTFLESCSTHRDNLAFISSRGRGRIPGHLREVLFEDVLILARAFKAHKAAAGTRSSCLSDNRYRIVTDMALQALGAVSVPRGSGHAAERDRVHRHPFRGGAPRPRDGEALQGLPAPDQNPGSPRVFSSSLATRSTPSSTRPCPTPNSSRTGPSSRGTSSVQWAWPPRSPPTTC